MRSATHTLPLFLAAGLASPSLLAQPLEPASRTDTRVERSAQSATPRTLDLRGEFASMRDELEGYPVGVSLGGTGHFAPPTATTVPDGFDWGLNNLRGQASTNFARVVDLSGSPIGGNATRAIQIVTGTAQLPGGFFTGASLRWDTPLYPTADHNARVSAEMYISTIAQQFTFEPISGFVNFITGRLLWGGVCSDPSPWDCNDLGVPVGPITTIFVLARGPSDFIPIFYPAAYCVDINGGIIPGCVPPPGSATGDPVSPPIGAWARWIAETSPDARVSFYLDRFDGEGEFLITRHEIITSSFIDRVQWNSAFESQDAFMLVDNIEASGPLFTLPKPPPLDCPYLDDLEWLATGPVLGQTDRWFAPLASQVSVVDLGGARGNVLQQTNLVPNGIHQVSASTPLPALRADVDTPSWTFCVDASTANGQTVRALTLRGEDGLTARLFLGAFDTSSFSFIPSLFVQVNPDYNFAGGPPSIGVDVVEIAPWDSDDSFRTICARVQRNGALVVSVDGAAVYTGQAFSASVNTFQFETDNNTSGEGARLRIDNVSLVCAAACPGDTNGDGVINFVDLNAVLGDFGMASTNPILPGDTNADGVVNFLDLNIVLSGFGNDCP